MYYLTITHPTHDTEYTCLDAGELAQALRHIARAQGQQLDSTAMQGTAEELTARADAEDIATHTLGRVTVRVEPGDASEYECDGHEDVYAGLGETIYCDGTCKPRPRLGRRAAELLAAATDPAHPTA